MISEHKIEKKYRVVVESAIKVSRKDSGGVWCGVVWWGGVWYGVVWCGVVWCGVVWCSVV